MNGANSRTIAPVRTMNAASPQARPAGRRNVATAAGQPARSPTMKAPVPSAANGWPQQYFSRSPAPATGTNDSSSVTAPDMRTSDPTF